LGGFALGVDSDNLKINAVAKTEECVMRTHRGMPTTLPRRFAQKITHELPPLIERAGADNDVIKLAR
jgi:hypothetical protein